MSNIIFPCHRICCVRNTKVHSVGTKTNIELLSSPKHEKNLIKNVTDLDRLTKEYLDTINEYRFHLGFSSLELSSELTNRAYQLAKQNLVENTSQVNLIHNNEPIGETVMSCQAPINNGYDIAKLIHDQLLIDLNNGHSTKKRYTPILNPDCHFLGFSLVRNKEKNKDFIVIYYYPVKKTED